jgi:hypothetical protein
VNDVVEFDGAGQSLTDWLASSSPRVRDAARQLGSIAAIIGGRGSRFGDLVKIVGWVENTILFFDGKPVTAQFLDELELWVEGVATTFTSYGDFDGDGAAAELLDLLDSMVEYAVENGPDPATKREARVNAARLRSLREGSLPRARTEPPGDESVVMAEPILTVLDHDTKTQIRSRLSNAEESVSARWRNEQKGKSLGDLLNTIQWDFFPITMNFPVPTSFLRFLDAWFDRFASEIVSATEDDLGELRKELFLGTYGAIECIIDATGEAGDAVRSARLIQSKLSTKNSAWNALDAEREIQAVGDRVESILVSTEMAAGKVASSELSSHYLSLASLEFRRYIGWTALLFTAVAATVALSWFIVVREPQNPISGTEVAKLALALPLLAMAAYAGRQAGHHRVAEQHAREAAVQLRTIRAFTEGLETGGRQEVMKAMGLRLFTKESADQAKDIGSFGAAAELSRLLGLDLGRLPSARRVRRVRRAR